MQGPLVLKKIPKREKHLYSTIIDTISTPTSDNGEKSIVTFGIEHVSLGV